MKNISKKIIVLITVLSVVFLSGCSAFKSGSKDFEYIKQRGVMKITIQSTRDKSYRFTVTDESAIKEIYEILSSAKVGNEKTTLEPDYIFEIYESSSKVNKFYYVTGIDKGSGANFYSDTTNYVVSKRLDNDIIKNFWNIRKPIDVENLYYESLYRTLEAFNTGDNANKKIGIDISSDVEMTKFQLSLDLMYFEERLKGMPNVSLIKNNDADQYEIIMKITTQGYTSTKYKSIVSFETAKGIEKPTVFYINNVYEQGDWKINILDKKPENF